MKFSTRVSCMQGCESFPDLPRGCTWRVDFDVPERGSTYTAFHSTKPTAKQLRRMKKFIRGIINAAA